MRHVPWCLPEDQEKKFPLATLPGEILENACFIRPEKP